MATYKIGSNAQGICANNEDSEIKYTVIVSMYKDEHETIVQQTTAEYLE